MPIYRREIIQLGATAGLVSLSGCETSFPSETLETATQKPKPKTPFDATEPEMFSKVDRKNLEGTIHQLVNDERKEHDLNSLGFNEDLAYIARIRSQDMAVNGYFGHEEPDGDTFRDRLREYGYEGQNTAENLVKPSAEPDTPIVKTAKRAVSGWMKSPPHRENILIPSFNVEGIGAYVTEDYTIYITQIFDEKLHHIPQNQGHRDK